LILGYNPPMPDESPNTKKLVLRGRGTSENPTGRFESACRSGLENDYLNHLAEEEDIANGLQARTEIFKDTSRSIINTNDSPDIGMEASINPYRGCEHGCIYCFARPSHEYFGLSVGVDFETKIFAKYDAADLLVQKLSSKNYQPKVIMMSGVTDCYQPLEKNLRLTRACMEVLRDFRNPVAVITKNRLVTRDIDIFKDIADYDGIVINMSVTTLDASLARTMEPRASQPALRLRAIEELAKNNIPVSVMIGPVLPGLTDHEIPAILKAVSEAGARGAHYTMLRLPYGVKDIFQVWLRDHYPDRAEKILSHVRDIRGGKLNDANFGYRMVGQGAYADQIAAMFNLYKKKYGLTRRYNALSTAHFRRDARSSQRDLFSC
jgi:DNA repair photolyase